MIISKYFNSNFESFMIIIESLIIFILVEIRHSNIVIGIGYNRVVFSIFFASNFETFQK